MHLGTFYVMVSPLKVDVSTYEGCVVFPFQGNTINNAVDFSNGAVGMQSYLFSHSGSCTGGAGSPRMQDKEISLAVPYFYQNRSAPGEPYHLQQSSFDQILFKPSSTGGTSTSSSPSTQMRSFVNYLFY